MQTRVALGGALCFSKEDKQQFFSRTNKKIPFHFMRSSVHFLFRNEGNEKNEVGRKETIVALQ